MKDQKQEVLDLETQEQSLTELSAYEKRVATLVQETKGLTIQGVKDTSGAKQVHEARIELKTTRVEIDKVRKELIAPALDWQKTVNAKAKELTNLIQPIEARLKEEEDQIKAEKRRIKEEKERARLIKIQERGSFILQHGGTFDGEAYEPGLNYPVHLTQDEIFEIEEDKWEELKAEILEHQEQIKAQEKRVKIEQAYHQVIQSLGLEHQPIAKAFILPLEDNPIRISEDLYQEALEECIEENWGVMCIAPPKLENIKKQVFEAKERQRAKDEAERQELKRLREVQQKKDQELQAKEKALQEEREALEAENRKKADEAVEELSQKQTPKEGAKSPEAPQKAAPSPQNNINDMVIQLCEKIVSKPFLSAQLPEAQEILKRINSHH